MMFQSAFTFEVMASLAFLACLRVGPASATTGDEEPGKLTEAGSQPADCAAGFGEAPERADRGAPVLPSRGINVPFTSLGGHILVPVRINGSEEANMVLDTGMSAPIVLVHDRQILGSADLPEGDAVQIAGAGGSDPVTGRMVGGAMVSIGDLHLTDQTIISTDELCGPSTFSLDGVIGKSIFDHYAVEIDFERSVLAIRESADVDTTGMTSLPITLEVGIPVVEAFLDGGDGSEVPVRLVVDLGARHTLSLHPDPVKGIHLPPKTLSTVVGRGIQGEVAGSVGRISGLRLGSFQLRGVAGSFTSPETGIACVVQGSKANGNLGIEILRRFRVVVDYPGSRLLLAPRPGWDQSFEYNMAGLSMEQRADGFYLVRDVIAGSPGAEAGLERGDLIVAIEGRAPSGETHPDTMALFRRDGSLLRITIEKGGERSERTLELRRLI